MSAIGSLIYQDIVGELERSLIKLTNTITKEITVAFRKIINITRGHSQNVREENQSKHVSLMIPV